MSDEFDERVDFNERLGSVWFSFRFLKKLILNMRCEKRDAR